MMVDGARKALYGYRIALGDTTQRCSAWEHAYYEEIQKRIACAGAYAELYDKHDGTVNDIHAMSSQCLSLHRDLVQYLADEALHLSASRKFAKEESRRGDHYRLQGVHSGPRRSIQAQRVLIIAPKTPFLAPSVQAW
jgi:hypothetical protein